MKRLTIFVLFSRDGTLEDYVLFLLKALKHVSTSLVVAVNGRLLDKNKKVVLDMVDELVIRDNIGFDVGAWKYVMTKHLGWSKIKEFDELVLTNDSYYGPFFPINEMFDTMAEKNLDFWGVTKHGSTKMLEEHLQSYFLVIRRNMLLSPYFQKYWEKQRNYRIFYHAISKHETVFTKYFEKHGFKWEPYINTADLDSVGHICHYAYNSYELILRGNPFLKRKNLNIDLGESMMYNSGSEL